MKRGVISWNGERSDQYGIEVEKYPNAQKPKRKVDVYTVPGRTGDIIMMQDAWENVEQKYEIWAGTGKEHSVAGSFSRVADWLFSPSGYCELWDDFDPMHYRLAYFDGQFDVSALSVGNVGRATIKFICNPKRYLVSGSEPIQVASAPFSLHNPTAFSSKPLVFVERSASGDGTVTVNGTVFTITDIPQYGLYIDCEKLDCYDTSGNNMNSHVTSSTSEFAVLDPGANAIGFTGNVQSIAIIPRWFEL